MEQATADRIRFWSIPVGIVLIAGLLITIIVMQVRSPEDATVPDAAVEATDEGQLDLSFLETRDDDDIQAAGDVDAPVALIVFSDYQCPYCAKWNEETLPQLMPQVDAGNLRIEWRDINMYGESSGRASRAAHAAGIQGKYWEYHAELFPDGEIRAEDGLTEDALVALAERLDLDPVQFREDLNSELTFAQIQNYASIGRDIGVSGTPSFIFGGEPIVGAQPDNVFLETFERVFAEAQ